MNTNLLINNSMWTIKMWKYIFCIITVIVLSVSGEITVENNAYKGIVISMRDDLEEGNCITNFNSIKDMLGNASELLYSSTGNRLSFGAVTVIVPNNWTCNGEAVSPEGIQLSDAHVWVGPSHPVFGNNPWTQQPKGCGEQGDFIYIPEGFLSSSLSNYGTPSQVFVHEWAKFRWGVFEESGHSGDALFPPSYHTMLNDSPIMMPNYCTDSEIIGEQLCANDAAEKDCLFTPSTTGSNDKITSSLLSVPFLKNVVQFCNSSTHNSNAPSKHNFLCEGKSAWEVINDSDDISATISSTDTRADPTFRLLRAASPFAEKIVIVMEHTMNTNLYQDTWTFLRDTVKQFIEVKVNSGAEVGLIIFSNEIKTLSNLTKISNSQERDDLSSLIPKDESDLAKSINLVDVISTAASLLRKDGVIILITANQESVNVGPDNLVSAANGSSVWPILYPHKEGTDTGVYETLANKTNGLTYVISSSYYTAPFTETKFQNVSNYYDMSSDLLQIQSITSTGGSLIEVDSKSCDAKEFNCIITLEVANPELYKDECIIEIYFAPNDLADAVIENPTGAEKMKIDSIIDSYIAYKLTGNMINNYSVKVTKSYPFDLYKVVVTLLATKKVDQSDYTVIVTASPSLENLIYTSTTAPVIYAQVAKNWDLVYFASVRATADGNNTILHDDGVGADITGNDGIYSAYLLGISATGKIDLTISVDDNDGNAKIAEVQKKSVPSNSTDKWCCGSQIDLNDVTFVSALNLNVTSAAVIGKVTGKPGQDLPPGSVKDLTADVVGTSNAGVAQVTLNFTATGDNLDQGIVNNYTVKSDQNDEHPCNNDDNAVSGTMVTCSFLIDIPDQDTLYTYHLIAVDENANEGKPSNKVRVFVSANIKIIPVPSQSLAGGAIAGIVIGVILFIVLVLLGVLLFLGKDEKEDSLAWNIVCCKCCKKEEEDNIYNKDPPTSARSNDVTRNPTVEPIRSIEDLYAKPDMDAKKRNQIEKIKDDHDDEDGGFTTHRSRSNDIPLQTNYSVNNTLERGSQQNLPINQVGIPIAENPSLQRNQRGTHQSYDRNTYNQRHNPNQDYRGVNNGYDASYDYGTNNSQPQTGRAPRTLTQV